MTVEFLLRVELAANVGKQLSLRPRATQPGFLPIADTVIIVITDLLALERR